MGSRQPDKIAVSVETGHRFDRFSSLQITNALGEPSEAHLEIGDDGAWPELRERVKPGERFAVYLNDRLRLSGWAEINEVPASNDSGVVVRLTCRTVMSDARYASADPSIKVKGTSVKDFVLACYAGLGLDESHFVFEAFADRDLLTGKASGAAPALDLEPLKTEQAKVQPPETIYEAVDRHLRRFGAMHWDCPDGRIMVGAPDDSQEPMFRLFARRGAASKANNVLSFTRTIDWSEVPSRIDVYGQTAGRDTRRQAIKGSARFSDIEEVAAQKGHFHRRVIIPTQQGRDAGSANHMALRELTARAKRKDAWEAVVDGWSFWNGNEQINWATNTTADVSVDAVGGVHGAYLLHRVVLNLDQTSGATSTLSLLGRGLWVL